MNSFLQSLIQNNPNKSVADMLRSQSLIHVITISLVKLYSSSPFVSDNFIFLIHLSVAAAHV